MARKSKFPRVRWCRWVCRKCLQTKLAAIIEFIVKEEALIKLAAAFIVNEGARTKFTTIIEFIEEA